MEILCLGLNHHTAPVELRERFAVPEGKLGEEAARLLALQGIEEAVVLSTCNRTEYYAAVESHREGVEKLREFLQSHGGRPLRAEHLYDRGRAEAAADSGGEASGGGVTGRGLGFGPTLICRSRGDALGLVPAVGGAGLGAHGVS